MGEKWSHCIFIVSGRAPVLKAAVVVDGNVTWNKAVCCSFMAMNICLRYTLGGKITTKDEIIFNREF